MAVKIRRPLDVVAPIGEQFLAFFRANGLTCEVGGSLRRRRAYVGDLDIVVQCDDLQDITVPDWVVWHRHGAQVAQGTMLLADGSTLTVDLWSATADQWGAFMWYITGSKELNIAMRQRAASQGLKLSQFGVFRDGVKIDDGTEHGVASVLGMDWIDPQDREHWAVDPVMRRFTVRSSGGERDYLVREAEGQWACSCPHFAFRRVECKHIKSVKDKAQLAMR